MKDSKALSPWNKITKPKSQVPKVLRGYLHVSGLPLQWAAEPTEHGSSTPSHSLPWSPSPWPALDSGGFWPRGPLFTLLSPHSGPYFWQQALFWPSVSLSDYPSGLLCRRKLIQDQGESLNTNCYWHSIPIETLIDSNNLSSAMPVLHTHLNHSLWSARLGRPCSLKSVVLPLALSS